VENAVNAIGREARCDAAAAASGLLARTAFLASIGELQTDRSSVVSRLGQSGSHGRQLVEELERFKLTGGNLERVSAGNWFKSGYPLRDLFIRTGELGSCNPIKLTYRRNLVDSLADVLIHTGSVGPRTGCAYTLAHEIGHLDGTHRSLNIAESTKQIAEGQIRKETSAIVSALRWQQEIGAPIQDSSLLQNQLRKNQLGSAIRHSWNYPELKILSNAEADTVANEYLHRAFSGRIGSGGQISHYSLSQLQETNFNARIIDVRPVVKSSLPLPPHLIPAADIPTARTAVARAGSPTASLVSEGVPELARISTRIGQTAGTLGLLYLVSDISDGFKQSPQEGARHIAKAGANWIGWEAGVAAMLKIAGRRTPLACLAAGVVGSIGADKIFDSLTRNESVKLLRSQRDFSFSATD
jgi:hypothetical protein